MTEELQGVEPEISPDGGMAEGSIAEHDGDQPGGSEKVDLTQLPSFRQYQSQVDRQIAAERREKDQLRQQLAALEQRMQDSELAGMDDYERNEYMAKRAQQEAQALRQQLQTVQAQQARREVLTEISQRHKVPLSVLEEAQSPDHAEALALRHLLEKREKAAQAETAPAAQPRNAVDVGGGGPRGAEARYRAQYQQLMKNRDTVGLVNLKMRAAQEGIDL